MQTTIETIAIIFAEILKRQNLKLEMSDSPDSVDGWDSLTHPELITAIEENLAIEFDFKELAAIKTIADLVYLIDSKRKQEGK